MREADQHHSSSSDCRVTHRHSSSVTPAAAPALSRSARQILIGGLSRVLTCAEGVDERKSCDDDRGCLSEALVAHPTRERSHALVVSTCREEHSRKGSSTDRLHVSVHDLPMVQQLPWPSLQRYSNGPVQLFVESGNRALPREKVEPVQQGRPRTVGEA